MPNDQNQADDQSVQNAYVADDPFATSANDNQADPPIQNDNINDLQNQANDWTNQPAWSPETKNKQAGIKIPVVAETDEAPAPAEPITTEPPENPGKIDLATGAQVPEVEDMPTEESSEESETAEQAPESQAEIPQEIPSEEPQEKITSEPKVEDEKMSVESVDEEPSEPVQPSAALEDIFEHPKENTSESETVEEVVDEKETAQADVESALQEAVTARDEVEEAKKRAQAEIDEATEIARGKASQVVGIIDQAIKEAEDVIIKKETDLKSYVEEQQGIIDELHERVAKLKRKRTEMRHFLGLSEEKHHKK